MSKLKTLGPVAALAAGAAVAVAPTAGTAAKAKRTYNVSFEVSGRQTGPTSAAGKVVGKPWGTGKYKVTYKGTTGYVTLTYKAGTIKFTEKVTQQGDTLKAKVTFTSGTKRFKGITGTGRSTSPLQGPYRYKGKVRY